MRGDFASGSSCAAKAQRAADALACQHLGLGNICPDCTSACCRRRILNANRNTYRRVFGARAHFKPNPSEFVMARSKFFLSTCPARKLQESARNHEIVCQDLPTQNPGPNIMHCCSARRKAPPQRCCKQEAAKARSTCTPLVACVARNLEDPTLNIYCLSAYWVRQPRTRTLVW